MKLRVPYRAVFQYVDGTVFHNSETTMPLARAKASYWRKCAHHGEIKGAVWIEKLKKGAWITWKMASPTPERKLKK